MTLSKIIAGLEILAGHFNDPDGHHTGAAHDEIFVFPTDRPLSADDAKKLAALGWRQPYLDRGEDEYGYPIYDPESGWSAFT